MSAHPAENQPDPNPVQQEAARSVTTEERASQAEKRASAKSLRLDCVVRQEEGRALYEHGKGIKSEFGDVDSPSDCSSESLGTIFKSANDLLRYQQRIWCNWTRVGASD